jgi:predicted dehydrogenase
MDEIEIVHVASSHADVETGGPLPKLGRIYRDWREALDDVEPGLVYVSLVNSQHAAVVRRALDRGHHVVVDKPGLLDLNTAKETVSLALSSGLIVAEATCYGFHPMFSAVRSVLQSLDAEVTKAVALFTPPVPVTDFRYNRQLGGGALLDTGPYIASLGRVLWEVEPERLEVIVGDRTSDSLETSYSVLAGYPGGRAVVGHFGFTTVYQNNLRLLGKACALEINRPFSAPPDMKVEISVQSDGQHYRHSVEPADSMRIFLSRVLEAVNTGSREFDDALLSDARTLDRLAREASSP